jgi:polyferredoxin
MPSSHKDRLQKQLANGLWHFVFLRGILLWGLGSGLAITLWQFFINNEPFIETLLTSVVSFSIAGLFFGLFLWYQVGKQYKRLK